jgi:putative MATE family efflux protein
MAAPLVAGMIFQTLYYFVDLYFVAQLGDVAIAGVSAAGNTTFIVFALTQVLGVGAVALISQAVGRKDQPEANLIFNQSLLLAALFVAITLIGCYSLSDYYLRSVTANMESARAGATYLHWFAPGLALQFALVVMGSALRATGIVQPTMVVQVVTLLLNALLAPVLIAGWGTHHPLGVAGAGLASSIAIAVGVIMLGLYFVRIEKYVAFHAEQWRPRLATWKRMLLVGLPAGGEFALIFLNTAVTYWAIRSFGSAAQAGYGIGSRILQGILVPALAIGIASAPIVGQNFGAGQPARVRATFQQATVMSSALMLALTVICQWSPELLVHVFARDAEVVRVAALFLRVASLGFVTQGVIFGCSSVFQGLGNTLPSIASSGARTTLYVLPTIWLSTQPFFRLEYVWYWSIGTTCVQTIGSLLLLKRELRIRLGPLESASEPPVLQVSA